RDEPYKHPDNPLLRIDDDTLTLGGCQGVLHGGMQLDMIVHESGLYRMWYRAIGLRESFGTARDDDASERGKGAYMAYAESDDGIHFHPVSVGQVEINGSCDNNLIEPDTAGEPHVRQCGYFHDPLDSE